MARPKNLLRLDFFHENEGMSGMKKRPFEKGLIYLPTIKFQWIFVSFKEFWINWWSYFTPINGRKSMGDKFQWTGLVLRGGFPQAHQPRLFPAVCGAVWLDAWSDLRIDAGPLRNRAVWSGLMKTHRFINHWFPLRRPYEKTWQKMAERKMSRASGKSWTFFFGG